MTLVDGVIVDQPAAGASLAATRTRHDDVGLARDVVDEMDFELRHDRATRLEFPKSTGPSP